MNYKFVIGEDYYLDNGQIILTEGYLKKRNSCCGSGCRHCPYDPTHTKGVKELRDKNKDEDYD